MATNGARTLEYCIKLCGKIQYLNFVQNAENASPCLFFFYNQTKLFAVMIQPQLRTLVNYFLTLNQTPQLTFYI